jgi:hypothetical protein
MFSCFIKGEQHMQFAVKTIEAMIYTIRGYRVMLDSDLAKLYGVETKRLNEQVKRNADRFPANFMFKLNSEEHEFLKSQIATSKIGIGGLMMNSALFMSIKLNELH